MRLSDRCISFFGVSNKSTASCVPHVQYFTVHYLQSPRTSLSTCPAVYRSRAVEKRISITGEEVAALEIHISISLRKCYLRRIPRTYSRVKCFLDQRRQGRRWLPRNSRPAGKRGSKRTARTSRIARTAVSGKIYPGSRTTGPARTTRSAWVVLNRAERGARDR